MKPGEHYKVANPDWHLTDGFHLWSMPSDGMRKLMELPGAVASVRFRPSSETILLRDYKALEESEKKEFHEHVKRSLSRPAPSSGLLIETLLEYQNHSIKPYGRPLTAEEKKEQAALFETLAELPPDTRQLPPISEDGQPGKGLKSAKVALYGGGDPGGNYGGLIAQPALHDIIDPETGYPRVSEVVMARTNLRYRGNTETVHLQSLDFLSLTSIRPYNSLHWDPSWMAQAHVITPTDIPGATNGNSFGLNGGIGSAAWIDARQTLLVSGFLKLYAEAGSDFQQGYRFGASALVGLLAAFSESTRASVNLESFAFTPGQVANKSYTKISSSLAWAYTGNSHGPQLQINSDIYLKPEVSFSDTSFVVAAFF